MISIKWLTPLREWSILRFLGLIYGLVSLIGCSTTTEEERDYMMIPRFYLETGSGGSDDRSVAIHLPLSEVEVLIDPLPVFVESDFRQVDAVSFEIGWGYAFSLKPDAARALYLLSVQHQGLRLVLFINGRAVGARVINEVMSEGILVVIPELEKAELLNSIELINDGIKDVLDN